MATVNENLAPTLTDAQIPVSRPRANATFFPTADEFFANPLLTVRRMHEDMDRFFAQALEAGRTGSTTQEEDGGARSDLTAWTPVIELRQQGSNFIACADLPGVKPEEVHVEASQDALVIRGERRQKQIKEEGQVHRTERIYGRFYRSIPLPEGADPDHASAAIQDGVLEVTVPISAQQASRREIPIAAGSLKRDTIPFSGPQIDTSR
ncbi:MAG TPA: Hsp20/alpha crystallin family protein [Bryobacteraceae bacterium]|nr:Hsp20/alpha crystallin family protein [Bryobacteraceae bacterium]